ncbi:TPA: hypothetical protein ACH3X1_016637 [Trebouxia sp. C0004]
MDMGLIDGTRCQSDQVLTNTITRKGSKRLVVHNVHQIRSMLKGEASRPKQASDE